eukprot:3335902-Prymnesium_polylepis.1
MSVAPSAPSSVAPSASSAELERRSTPTACRARESAALKLSDVGHSPLPETASRPAAIAPAASQRPPLLHAAMAALKLISVGATPHARISSSSISACSDCPPLSHAAIAASKL